MTNLIDRTDVERVLSDDQFRVPEADAAATRPADRLRACASRFVNGAAHQARRQRIGELLARLDFDDLSAAAAAGANRMVGAPVSAVAEHVPVARLSASLGFSEPESLPPLVAEIATIYPTGGSSDAADAATERLLVSAHPAAERVGDSELLVQLLVQAFGATAGLIVAALSLPEATDLDVPTAELLATTLRDAPPVPLTRRIAPDGDVLVLHLDGPDRERSHGNTRTLAFGAGQRSCPAPQHALTIATAVVDRLRAC